MFRKLQRLRFNQHIRDLCAETVFSRAQLIQPLFIVEGVKEKQAVPSLEGTFRMSIDDSIRQIGDDLENGVTQFLIFFVPQKKESRNFTHDFPAQALSEIKKRFGSDCYLWIDTCLCSKTDSGHCCIFEESGAIDFEATHKELGDFAVSCAQAGANGIAPSDMIDGRVAHLRQSLDGIGETMMPIMSYSTKFASAFYGPFREAADSAPQFGDRKQYQLDVRSRSGALEASKRCAAEGADLLMVKPGITSLDLISPIHSETNLPVGAYQVSGEYGGMVLLGQQGLIDFDRALLESFHVYKRAGAQFVITYGARYAKKLGL